FLEITRQSRQNNIPEVIRFEEGLLAYLSMLDFPVINSKNSRAFIAIQKMLNRNTRIFLNDKVACFYPELLCALYAQQGVTDIPECIKIPAVTCDENFLKILNTTFDYNPAVHEFPQKYIYFATAAYSDEIYYGELDLVLKIADLVGRDNLLVKMHPRDKSDIYEKAGLAVSRDTSVPWEVIQLNHDFSKHVFLSMISSSIVNVMAMKNESIPAYFLYLMAEDDGGWFIKTIKEHNQRIMKGLHEMGLCKSVKIIDNLQEILD
ncbi:MAG: hypothetical protein IJQ56_06715, partial [Synergistaceae bacterium]|nr:hypothetical protein [Synergistaceae bacterium]